jgi:hypothetical protein
LGEQPKESWEAEVRSFMIQGQPGQKS